MKQKNYYEILGVQDHAAQDDIKRAFRSLAKTCHPDKNPGKPEAEARFKEINEAYEILSDPHKRKKYDDLRRYAQHGPAEESMSYDDFIRRFGGEYAPGQADREFTWGFGGSTLDDIFGALFGGRRQKSARRPAEQPYEFRFESQSGAPNDPQQTGDQFFKRKGPDAYVDITINLAQALLGSKIRVRTPSGQRVNVRIPNGTQPGATLRVRGMGFREGTLQGDLYIRTHLHIPTSLTPEQESLVRQIALMLGLKH